MAHTESDQAYEMEISGLVGTVPSRKPMTWRVRLYAGQVGKMTVVAGSAIFAGILGVALVHGVLGAILGPAMIFGSTAELWLGTRYRLDGKGATSASGLNVTTILWPDVKRIIVNDAGVTLSPLVGDSRLSAFRGVFLRPGILGQAGLLDAIHTYGGDHVRGLG